MRSTEDQSGSNRLPLLIGGGLVVLILAVTITARATLPSAKPQSFCDRAAPKAQITLAVPQRKTRSEDVQLVVTLPCEYWRDRYEGPFSFRQVNYRTGNPVEGVDTEDPDVISLSVRASPYDPTGENYQQWEAYPPGDEERFGLEYRPQIVPSRPEDHWKVGYFKQGVSGAVFHIWCWPESVGFSLAPQKWCVMEMNLNPTPIRDRVWSAEVFVRFKVERIKDWPSIESRVRRVLSNVALQ